MSSVSSELKNSTILLTNKKLKNNVGTPVDEAMKSNQFKVSSGSRGLTALLNSKKFISNVGSPAYAAKKSRYFDQYFKELSELNDILNNSSKIKIPKQNCVGDK